MSKRKEKFYIGEYYHVFNRGVDKRVIFLEKGDLQYFFDSIIISNKFSRIKNTTVKNLRKREKEKAKQEEKLVEIIAYSLLPNHFHFVLKEVKEAGISKFMQKLGNSYSKFFNTKYDRSGTLFQGRFKAKRLSGEDKKELDLEIVTAYVNLNYKHHGYDFKKDLIKSSIFEFLGEEKGELICNQKEIEKQIKNIGGLEKYKKWIQSLSKEFTKNHDKNPDLLDFNELE